MKKRWMAGMLMLLCSIGMSRQALAGTRTVSVFADRENIPAHQAGEAFLPLLEVEEEDQDSVRMWVRETSTLKNDPTVPVTVYVSLYGEGEELEDDLKIHGTGIRSTYVDSVSEDGQEARGRLLVYPFYELPSPVPVTDREKGEIRWDAVPYAGSYELILTTGQDGDRKTIRRYTSETSYALGSLLKEGEEIGAAVRALPGKQAGGSSVVGDDTLSESALEKEYRYYNIAPSQYGISGNPDLSDYEQEEIWEDVGKTTAAVDGNFAGYSRSLTASAGAPGGVDGGFWRRTGYRWQYILSGTAFAGGWKKLGSLWYYFDPDGYMHTGWLQDKGVWYYLEPAVGASAGAMYTGVHVINGKTCEFASDGGYKGSL